MGSEDSALKVKVDVLLNEYKEVRSHIQLLHRQSIGLAMVLVPVLLWVAEHTDVNSDAGGFVVFSPFIMMAVVGVMNYVRTASLVYMDVCRAIERRTNELVGEESLFNLETFQRKRFDRVCFHRWGPGRMMYTLMGVMFLLVYTYLCVRSAQVITLKLHPFLPLWSLIPIVVLVYLLPVAVVGVSAYTTVKVWMEYIGKQALEEKQEQHTETEEEEPEEKGKSA